jgi:hypothetical protein
VSIEDLRDELVLTRYLWHSERRRRVAMSANRGKPPVVHDLAVDASKRVDPNNPQDGDTILTSEGLTWRWTNGRQWIAQPRS